MSETLPRATHKGELPIGSIRISCYVLQDSRRVLSQTGMIKALGMSHGSSARKTGDRLARFVGGKNLNPFIDNKLVVVTTSPIIFRTTSGQKAYGYEATILADICEAVLAARDAGVLQKQQLRIAERAEILVRGFARVGIIALVDEVTGYQEVRDRLALEKILEKWITKELLPWTKRFPNEFYKEMFRLKGWQYSPLSVKRPKVIGHYTNDIVYDRLEVGLLNELKRKNPKIESGYRKSKHHQWLTVDVGHPKLRDHLQGVIALMRASANWNKFKRLLNRAYPRKGMTLELPLDDD